MKRIDQDDLGMMVQLQASYYDTYIEDKVKEAQKRREEDAEFEKEYNPFDGLLHKSNGKILDPTTHREVDREMQDADNV